MSKYWIETVWQLPKEEVEDFSTILAEWGCLGSFEDLPLEENTQGPTSLLKAYFPDQDLEELKIKLSENTTLRGPMNHLMRRGPESIQKIPEAGWATEWKKYFKPFFLTKKIVICPSWETYKKTGDEKVVILDPGMAFGTGQHDTTRFCAEFICELKTENPHLKSFLDVGCGSGILSLIAKKLGFEEVVGIDNDPVAIETAKENLKRNPDRKEIDFRTGAVTAPLQFDIVVANIIAETLCELHDGLIEQMSSNGYLILSGILPERAALVKEKFAVGSKNFLPLHLIDEKKSKDWHAYLYCKK